MTLVWAIIAFDMTLKVQATKAEKGKYYYSELKMFYTAKEIINRVIRQCIEWVKIFMDYVCAIMPRLYKLNSVAIK